MKRITQYLPQIKTVFATATLRQTGITFSATLVNGVLGALFYILVARHLGPSNYGLLAVTLTTLTLVGDIGDLGTNTGLVRFIGRYKAEDQEKVEKFLKLGFEIKIVVSIAVALIGFILSPYLARLLFSKPQLTLPLRLASIGVGSYLLFSFATHALQGFEKFWSWSTIQIFSNSLRLILIYVLITVALLGIESTLLIYLLTPLLGFLLGMIFLPKKFLKSKGEMSVVGEFFHYNKWVAAFTLIAAVSSRLDTFISARLLTTEDLGLYSAANQLSQVVPQLVAALGTVIAPKMASKKNLNDLISYLKKAQLFVFIIAVLLVASIPIITLLIPVLLGSQYTPSIPIFIILLFAMLIFLISVPIHNSIFYYFAMPKVFFWLTIGHFLIISLAGWNLISRYGVYGAASTVLVGQAFNFLVPLLWLVRRLRIEKANTV